MRPPIRDSASSTLTENFATHDSSTSARAAARPEIPPPTTMMSTADDARRSVTRTNARIVTTAEAFRTSGGQKLPCSLSVSKVTRVRVVLKLRRVYAEGMSGKVQSLPPDTGTGEEVRESATPVRAGPAGGAEVPSRPLARGQGAWALRVAAPLRPASLSTLVLSQCQDNLKLFSFPHRAGLTRSCEYPQCQGGLLKLARFPRDFFSCSFSLSLSGARFSIRRSHPPTE